MSDCKNQDPTSEKSRVAIAAIAEAAKGRLVRGTSECPICGFDKPHHHEAGIVEWHRTGIAPKGFLGPGPMNDAQRNQERIITESRWHEGERRREFMGDPVGTLRRGKFAVDGEMSFQRDHLWVCQEWIVELLTARSAIEAQLATLTRERDEAHGVIESQGREAAEMDTEIAEARGMTLTEVTDLLRNVLSRSLVSATEKLIVEVILDKIEALKAGAK